MNNDMNNIVEIEQKIIWNLNSEPESDGAYLVWCKFGNRGKTTTYARYYTNGWTDENFYSDEDYKELGDDFDYRDFYDMYHKDTNWQILYLPEGFEVNYDKIEVLGWAAVPDPNGGIKYEKE